MKTSVTRLTPRQSPLRLLLLFQSHKQALSWFTTVALIFSLIHLITSIFQLRNIPVELLFLSIITGSSISLIFALPFEFCIKHKDIKSTTKLHREIELSGYEMNHAKNQTADKVCFLQNGPKWLSWRESDIIVKKRKGLHKNYWAAYCTMENSHLIFKLISNKTTTLKDGLQKSAR